MILTAWKLLVIVKVFNFLKFTSYCSLKPLWSGMGEVVPARTSPTLHPPSPPAVHQLSWLALLRVKSYSNTRHAVISWQVLIFVAMSCNKCEWNCYLTHAIILTVLEWHLSFPCFSSNLTCSKIPFPGVGSFPVHLVQVSGIFFPRSFLWLVSFWHQFLSFLSCSFCSRYL